MHWAKPDAIENATKVYSDPAKYPPGKDFANNGTRKLVELSFTLPVTQKGNTIATLHPGQKTANLTPAPKEQDISAILKRYS